MAETVNLGDQLQTDREETARADLTVKMIPIMVETIERFLVMGATPEHIVMILHGTISEIQQRQAE